MAKILTGTIVSKNMNNTVVVEVESTKVHKTYARSYKAHKKFKAHYEGTELNEGDIVRIQEVAPISKTKSWKIIEGKKETK